MADVEDAAAAVPEDGFPKGADDALKSQLAALDEEDEDGEELEEFDEDTGEAEGKESMIVPDVDEETVLEDVGDVTAFAICL